MADRSLFRYDDPLSVIPTGVNPSGEGETFPVVLRYGVAKYAKGGMVAKAESVRRAGRGADDHIVHVNDAEFGEMKQMWGEPTINPETGQPEFLFGFLKKLLPIAAAFIPGIGPAIGGALGLSGTAGSVVGGALLNGGLSALQGGDPLAGAAQGALGGASGGGQKGPPAPTTAANKLGTASGNPIAASADKAAGLAAKTASNNIVAGDQVPVSGTLLPGTADTPTGIPGTPQKKPGFLNRDFLGIKGLPNWAGIPLAGLALSELLRKRDDESGGISSSMNADQLVGAKLQPTFGQKSLPAPSGFYSNLSARQGSAIDQGEQRAYGSGPEGRFFNYAKGGRASFAVKGAGSGRSDDIPAMLSDGEYVIDADTVAMLGDGSSKAGAEALDRLRVNLRKHKGRNMARGRLAAKAKPPEHYLRGGRV